MNNSGSLLSNLGKALIESADRFEKVQSELLRKQRENSRQSEKKANTESKFSPKNLLVQFSKGKRNNSKRNNK